MSPSLKTLIQNRNGDERPAETAKPAAKQAARPAPRPASKPARENRLTRWYRETVSELKKVVWPTREEWTNLTLIVLAVTVAMGIFLGGMDFIFERLLLALLR